MTILSRRDIELHEEDGTHIDPGRDRNLKAKLNRHLARHSREDLPDLSLLGQDLSEAERVVRESQTHHQAVKKYVIEQARLHFERGVKQSIIADRLGVNVRTLQDWLKYGHVRSRNRASPE